MQWRDAYLLGIREIDDQHKGLVDNFRLIEEAVRRGESWSSVYFHVADLKERVRIHYGCEEALMRVFGYPDMRLHAAEHTHFLKELTEIERRSIEKSIEKELLSFLGAWMSKHILASDRDFARYVLAGGAALAA